MKVPGRQLWYIYYIVHLSNLRLLNRIGCFSIVIAGLKLALQRVRCVGSSLKPATVILVICWSKQCDPTVAESSPTMLSWTTTALLHSVQGRGCLVWTARQCAHWSRMSLIASVKYNDVFFHCFHPLTLFERPAAQSDASKCDEAFVDMRRNCKYYYKWGGIVLSCVLYLLPVSFTIASFDRLQDFVHEAHYHCWDCT